MWFFVIVLFSGPESSWSACGRIYVNSHHTVATREGHDVAPFFNPNFFVKMRGQNETKGTKKFLIATVRMFKLGPVERRKSQELLWPTARAARTLTFIIFWESVTRFSYEWLMKSLTGQFQQVLYTCIYTFMFWRCCWKISLHFLKELFTNLGGFLKTGLWNIITDESL